MKKIKFLALGVAFAVLMLCTGATFPIKHNLAFTEIFSNISTIEFIRNGQINEVDAKSDDAKVFLNEFKKLLQGANVQPAFAVSINEFTKKEMQTGDWVQINFKKELSHNQMAFSKLLFKVDGNNNSINLIRYTKEYQYQGRCIYIALDKPMQQFHSNINFLFK